MSEQTMEYTIVVSDPLDGDSFVVSINQLLVEGWQLHGAPVASANQDNGHVIIQSLTRHRTAVDDVSNKLTPKSLSVFMRKGKDRVIPNDETLGADLNQLTFSGNPDGYRWLAALLSEAADDAKNHKNRICISLNPREPPQLDMTDWASLDFEIRCEVDPLARSSST